MDTGRRITGFFGIWNKTDRESWNMRGRWFVMRIIQRRTAAWKICTGLYQSTALYRRNHWLL